MHLVCHPGDAGDGGDAGAGTLLPVKVVPGASRDRVVGVLGTRLKVTVSQVAEKGAANKAVAAVLAKALGVRGREVELVSGMTNPEKVFRIRGLRIEEVRNRLTDE